jgi:hypothetical protein
VRTVRSVAVLTIVSLDTTRTVRASGVAVLELPAARTVRTMVSAPPDMSGSETPPAIR